MGWVWEATDPTSSEDGGRVALKFLKGGKAEDRRRFLREARAALAVRHPNVIVMREVVELPDEALVTVMEFLEGESLGAVLKREKKLALDVVCAILTRAARGLEAAHAVGIIHRDFKPDNVFLTLTADGAVDVKVLDFGVAKLTASDGLAARTQALTGTGAMVGTPYYMSPEQVVSEDDLDGRADVWSLGVVLYECLAGVRPTEAENVGRVLKRIIVADFTPLQERAVDLPADVLDLVGRMLIADRDQRPALKRVNEVLDAHARSVIPRFRPSESNTSNDALALADTVIATTEATRTNRGDTHSAVSVVRSSSSSPGVPQRRRPSGVALLGAALMVASVGLAWKLGTKPTKVATVAPTETAKTTTTTPTPPTTPMTMTSLTPTHGPVETTASASSAPPSPVIVVRLQTPTPASTARAAATRTARTSEAVADGVASTTPSANTSATSAPSAAQSSARSRMPPNLATNPKD